MIVEEKTISSDRIYTGKVISLKVDTVEIENKGYQKREIVEHQGAVAIVALTDDDKVVLIKQFRKPIEQVIWEIPAGKLEIGENPKDCAIRELKEETGYSAKNIKLIHKFFTSAGFSNQKIYIFLATGLNKGEPEFDEDEIIEKYEIDINEARNMVINNEIEDAKTSRPFWTVKSTSTTAIWPTSASPRRSWTGRPSPRTTAPIPPICSAWLTRAARPRCSPPSSPARTAMRSSPAGSWKRIPRHPTIPCTAAGCGATSPTATPATM